MSMYNEYQKDDYLLKSKLLGITDFKSLEKAESFVFSYHAGQMEQNEYKINIFQLEDFKNLHKHLFQDINAEEK